MSAAYVLDASALLALLHRDQGDGGGPAQHLSLGDRACLAIALRRGLAALNADRGWMELDLAVEIQPIR